MKKNGIINNYYLGDFWVCISELLDDEFDYVENSFTQLQHP